MGAAWLRVVQYLKDHDNKEHAAGHLTVFDDVNPRVCQARWKGLSREFADYEAEMAIATGVNPQLTDRLKHIQPVYEFEKACRKTTTENKDKRQRKKARTESNRVEGQNLLDRSRMGLRRGPGSDQSEPGSVQVAPDTPQLPQGFLSGTESESNLSTVSNFNPRTPAMRKRAMTTMLSGQLQDAATFLRTQLEMITEDREERRKAREEDEERRRMKEEQDEERWRKKEEQEEERRRKKEGQRKEEENLRREQFENQQKTLMELVKNQTESMERIAHHQSATSERIAQQQSASTERLILALVAGINKKN